MRTVLALLLLLNLPATAGEWKPAGTGDCPGKEVLGTPSEFPDPEQCTPTFNGKTALCFSQVCNRFCNYIDVYTKDCRGGAEEAQIYTCVAEPLR